MTETKSCIVDEQKSDYMTDINVKGHPEWVPTGEQFCKDFWEQLNKAPQVAEAWHIMDMTINEIFGYAEPSIPLDPSHPDLTEEQEKQIKNAGATYAGAQLIATTIAVEIIRLWELTQHPETYKQIVETNLAEIERKKKEKSHG